jgi:hypothetical protein
MQYEYETTISKTEGKDSSPSISPKLHLSRKDYLNAFDNVIKPNKSSVK